jgi:hypothetical protein
MLRRALLLALLLAPAPAFADSDDFSDHYGSPRDQCNTGSCHAFASVALLEAAMRRRRRDSERLTLSDADLFLQTTVINGRHEERGAPRQDVLRGSVRAEPPALMEKKLVEGGWPHLDLEHALRHGVALEEDAPWSEFLPRFERFRAQRRAEFAAARRAQGQAADADGETEALIAYEESLSPSRERRQREESFFYRDLPAVEAGRARVRELLAGFAVHRSTFASMVPGPQDAAECRRRAQAVRARLKEDFVVRRPNLVCLLLDGLEGWGARRAQHAKHCVAIAGWEQPRGGPLTLRTRNSWGRTIHPEIPEEQFCRIHDVVSLRP